MKIKSLVLAENEPEFLPPKKFSSPEQQDDAMLARSDKIMEISKAMEKQIRAIYERAGVSIDIDGYPISVEWDEKKHTITIMVETTYEVTVQSIMLLLQQGVIKPETEIEHWGDGIKIETTISDSGSAFEKIDLYT
jgi:hypothetical protein